MSFRKIIFQNGLFKVSRLLFVALFVAGVLSQTPQRPFDSYDFERRLNALPFDRSVANSVNPQGQYLYDRYIDNDFIRIADSLGLQAGSYEIAKRLDILSILYPFVPFTEKIAEAMIRSEKALDLLCRSFIDNNELYRRYSLIKLLLPDARPCAFDDFRSLLIPQAVYANKQAQAVLRKTLEEYRKNDALRKANMGKWEKQRAIDPHVPYACETLQLGGSSSKDCIVYDEAGHTCILSTDEFNEKACTMHEPGDISLDSARKNILSHCVEDAFIENQFLKVAKRSIDSSEDVFSRLKEFQAAQNASQLYDGIESGISEATLTQWSRQYATVHAGNLPSNYLFLVYGMSDSLPVDSLYHVVRKALDRRLSGKTDSADNALLSSLSHWNLLWDEELPKELQAAAKRVSENEMSKPVSTPYGFFLLFKTDGKADQDGASLHALLSFLKRKISPYNSMRGEFLDRVRKKIAEEWRAQDTLQLRLWLSSSSNYLKKDSVGDLFLDTATLRPVAVYSTRLPQSLQNAITRRSTGKVNDTLSPLFTHDLGRYCYKVTAIRKANTTISAVELDGRIKELSVQQSLASFVLPLQQSTVKDNAISIPPRFECEQLIRLSDSKVISLVEKNRETYFSGYPDSLLFDEKGKSPTELAKNTSKSIMYDQMFAEWKKNIRISEELIRTSK
jgi:hypothetical protein